LTRAFAAVDMFAMRLRRCAFGLVAAYLVLGETSLARAEPASSSPSEASAGDFAVMQFATTDPDKLLADWQKPTPGVEVTGASSASRHQPISTFLVFKGSVPNKDGNCDVTADFETLSPSGAVYNVTRNVSVCAGVPPASNLDLQLAMRFYTLSLGDHDLAGAYTVRVTTTDNVSGAVVHTEQTLRLGE
jgi:hypothetical protein